MYYLQIKNNTRVINESEIEFYTYAILRYF